MLKEIINYFKIQFIKYILCFVCLLESFIVSRINKKIVENRNQYIKDVYQDNKSIDKIEDYCKIFIFKDLEKSYHKKYNMNMQKIKYFHKLFKNNESIEECINKVIKERGVKNVSSNRTNYRKKIQRCFYLYNNYGGREKKLNQIYFSFNKMSIMPENKWNKWILYLDDFINKDL